MTGKILTIAQQKGGAGKSTLAAHLALAWALKRKSVALVDIDPQQSLAAWYDQREITLGADQTQITFASATGWRAAGVVEKLAKTQFLDQFEALYNASNSEASALSELPTAFDYIRLGHPLSCILEWVIANLNKLPANNVISFSYKTVPILSILTSTF